MKFPIFLTAAILFLSPTIQCVEYSQLLTSSVIARNTPLDKDSTGAILKAYEHGVMERALAMVYNKTGNATYYNYLKSDIDNLISPSGVLLDYNLTYYTLDDVRLGPEFLYLYLSTGSSNEGGMWHRSTCPNQMWLDGQYMALPQTAWNDIALQFSLLETHVRNATTGLLKHGYDGGKSAIWADPITGSAPLVWDRALGWHLMALVDVLDYLPCSHPVFDVLKSHFSRAAAAVRATADPDIGAWWLVMSQEYTAAPGNYIESSGSAIFVYAFLKGVRVGYLPSSKYLPAAKKAHEYLVTECAVDKGRGIYDWLGMVKVGSLGSNADYAYYISVPKRTNDLKGIGPFMFASVEIEMLE
ncbi:glycoside hydrolase family 105 protein [Choiromyces venosus 120613-1]|uniref:Glycoside hydrolase family 105 protein n=1 Tax=Choiromyces venosus 120613-1 TaxID=1336337 RepID=A0A3N4ISG2_9PEZI|nr:glycoside hydrolase family 105 protein [Choiromyces venosus 120613-1]